MTRGDKLCQLLRRRRVRREHLAYRDADVESDRIGELDRAHRHSELERRLVDGLGRDTLVHAAHCRHQVRREHAVDEESWRTFHRQRQSIDLPDERGRREKQRGRRIAAVHDLDQHHLCDGIEEMEADEARPVATSQYPRAGSTTCWPRGWPSVWLSPRLLRTGCASRRRSKIASMMTSARATPSPATSDQPVGCVAHPARVAPVREEFCARPIAGASAPRSGPAASP